MTSDINVDLGFCSTVSHESVAFSNSRKEVILQTYKLQKAVWTKKHEVLHYASQVSNEKIEKFLPDPFAIIFGGSCNCNTYYLSLFGFFLVVEAFKNVNKH